MPQLVPKINFYMKFGGYEPSTGFHVTTPAEVKQSTVDYIVPALLNLINDQVTLTRWEGRDFDGTYLDGGVIGLPGNNTGVFQDFRDETHVLWVSAGSERPSGNFFPGRTNQFWLFGEPQAPLIASLDVLRDALIDAGGTDSEGFQLTAYRSFRPGRRRNVRLTP